MEPSPETVRKLATHALIIYDGECGFCQYWIQFILNHDPHGYFLFAALQTPWTESLHHRKYAGRFDSILLYEGGKIREKSEGVFRIAKHLNAPWKWARIFTILPVAFLDFLYDALAKRRHALSLGRFCKILTPEERKRFLD